MTVKILAWQFAATGNRILLAVSSVKSDSLLRDYVYIYSYIFFWKWKTGVCSEGRRDIKRWPSQSRNNLICFHLYRPTCFIVCFLTLGVNWGDRAADWVKGLVERYENMTEYEGRCWAYKLHYVYWHYGANLLLNVVIRIITLDEYYMQRGENEVASLFDRLPIHICMLN
jgi:hypothetical protein